MLSRSGRSRPPAADVADAAAAAARPATAATASGDLATAPAGTAATGGAAGDASATATWAAATGRTTGNASTATWAARRRRWRRRRRDQAYARRRRWCRRGCGGCRPALFASAASDCQRQHGGTAEQRECDSRLGFHQALTLVSSSHCQFNRPVCTRDVQERNVLPAIRFYRISGLLFADQRRPITATTNAFVTACAATTFATVV